MITRLPLLALILGACAHQDGPEAQWHLVGLYDGAGLTRDATPPDPAWAWRPAPGMSRACGAPRTPFGLGRTEADALMTGQTGALVVLLNQKADTPGQRLTRDDVQLWLNSRCDGAPLRLEPAVMPRALRVQMDKALPEAELLQSLAMTTCMEHRLQRAWIGGDDLAVQGALLMAPAADDADRAFVGQGDPVPALWGAPDVCLLTPPQTKLARLTSATSPTLHPADVWGGTLRTCTDAEAWQAGPDHGGLVAPLSIKGPVATQLPEPVGWHTINLDLVAPDRVRVSQDGEPIAELPIRQVGASSAAASHIADLLAAIPPEYPTFELTSAVDEWLNDGRDAPVVYHFTALVVPAWQLQEPCLTEDEAGALDTIGAPYPETPTQADPIGELLSAPERLQVLTRTDSGWSELNPHRGRALPHWGTPITIEAARRPLVALGAAPPTPEQSQAANRAAEESLVVTGGVVLLIFAALGLRRVPELWAPQPELRSERWTERPTEDGP